MAGCLRERSANRRGLVVSDRIELMEKLIVEALGPALATPEVLEDLRAAAEDVRRREAEELALDAEAVEAREAIRRCLEASFGPLAVHVEVRLVKAEPQTIMAWHRALRTLWSLVRPVTSP
jgi:hypothetical protein